MTTMVHAAHKSEAWYAFMRQVDRSAFTTVEGLQAYLDSHTKTVYINREPGKTDVLFLMRDEMQNLEGDTPVLERSES